MDRAQNNQATIGSLTRLIILLAENFVDVKANLMAMTAMQKANLLGVAEVDPDEFDRMIAEAVVASKQIVQSQFLSQLAADPELAWLAAQVRSETIQ